MKSVAAAEAKHRLGAILNVLIAAVVAPTLLFASCADQATRAVIDTDTTEAAIERTYDAWVDAANAKDLERWASFLADDPLFLPPSEPPLRGGQAIREHYEQAFADPHFALVCRQQRVAVSASGDMAWASGLCESTFSDSNGQLSRGSSKWAKVWLHMPDGSWKCTLNSWSLNGPAEEAR